MTWPFQSAFTLLLVGLSLALAGATCKLLAQPDVNLLVKVYIGSFALHVHLGMAGMIYSLWKYP